MNGPAPRLSIRLGFLLLMLAASVPAARAADPAAPASGPLAGVKAWADTLPLDDRALAEIDRFAADKKAKFPDGYAAAFAGEMRKRVFATLAEALSKLPDRGGETSIDVTFMEPGIAGLGGEGLEKDFEESVVRTECLAFFADTGVSPEAALKIYTDPAFRMSTRSRIKRIWTDGGLDCVETEGVKFLVSPTLYCSSLADYRDSTVAVQHSQAVTSGDGYDTVYFKESLKTFVKVPGGMVFHYVNFFRGGGLGGVKKSIGKGKIVESETKVIEELGKRLSERPAQRE